MTEDSHFSCCSKSVKVKEGVKYRALNGESKTVRLARTTISYLVAAACLFWVFHDLNLSRVWQSVAGIQWGWMALGMALQVLAYLCVAWQWQLLLRPIGPIPFFRAAQAVFAGRFANDVLPVQLGYIIRAYLVSRWMRTGLASVIPSLLVERLWDGLWLVVGIGLAALFVPLPAGLLQARNILSSLVLIGTVLVVFVAWRQRKMSASQAQGMTLHWKPVRAGISFIGRMAEGVRGIGRSHLLPAILILALLKLVIQGLAFFTMMWAYGFQLSVWAGMAVFLIAYLGICIPSTPASVGIFQLFSIAGLEVFGVAKAEAAGFSLVAFAASTLPLSIIGFFALAQSGLTLRQIRTEAGKLRRGGPSG
jgi:uncharacterized protein (TIRG00374 family)